MDNELIEVTVDLMNNRDGALDNFRLRWEGAEVSIKFYSPSANWSSSHESEHPEDYLWRLIYGKHHVHTNMYNLLKNGKNVYCEVVRRIL